MNNHYGLVPKVIDLNTQLITGSHYHVVANVVLTLPPTARTGEIINISIASGLTVNVTRSGTMTITADGVSDTDVNLLSATMYRFMARGTVWEVMYDN